MRIASLDLIVVVLVTLLAFALTAVGIDSVVLRLLFVLPLVVFLPGYAITAALLPEREFGPSEKLLYWFGVSLAVVSIGGLILNYTPWGLQSFSWVALLAGITLAASSIALYRRTLAPEREFHRESFTLSLKAGLFFALALLVSFGAIEIAERGARRQWVEDQGITQLWIQPSMDRDQDLIRLGINNLENQTLEYRLEIEVGGQVVREAPSILLEAGGRWEEQLELPIAKFGPGQIEANLYLVDPGEGHQPQEVYRRVTLWRGEPAGP